MLYVKNTNSQQLLIEKQTSFIHAVENGNIVKIKHLIDSGIHPDTRYSGGKTALHKATLNNNYDTAFELLNNGATVDITNNTGNTALMMACANGYHEMVLLFLFYGANPELINNGCLTALMIAASNGHSRVIGVLLDTNPRVDLYKTDLFGKNALDIAIVNGYENAAKMLRAAIGTNGSELRNIHERRWSKQPLLAGGAL